ncbi:hypothetical protein HMPREF0381_0878 [Lachnoanaerobaculum saburreum DSM 3986]|uniref:Uncharacterized protein n=1 Tax=Lachnoanaerobaculum saburreum DSM 3986 TaxID=887325 RepID=E6LLP3_9FIRM|nr:hypothetical protein HMPREF0381_0878 [Lachnoanaerobaculum saburreum DSM 3986]
MTALDIMENWCIICIGTVNIIQLLTKSEINYKYFVIMLV